MLYDIEIYRRLEAPGRGDGGSLAMLKSPRLA